MGAKNCARCGRIFNHLAGPPLCHACREDDEKAFERVKEYLFEYPGASMTEVATALELPLGKIKRFLKEGRLEIKEGSNFILECERCGVSIKSGKYCEVCSHDLAFELKSGSPKATTGKNQGISKRHKESERMRYFNTDRHRS